MHSIDLSGKRVLLTQASDFMGPALAEVFRECGADLISADGLVADPDYPQRLLAESGAIDVLLLNLGIPAPTTAAPEVMDDEWRHAFSAMVDPLPRADEGNRRLPWGSFLFPASRRIQARPRSWRSEFYWTGAGGLRSTAAAWVLKRRRRFPG